MQETEAFKKTGFNHIRASFGYSVSGARYLLREQAMRHEVLMLAVASVLFALVQAPVSDYLTLTALFILVVCVEAINTAGETIVDKVSPEISEFAKKTKDLLSFAVFCTLLLFGGFTVSVILDKAAPLRDMDMLMPLPAETETFRCNSDRNETHRA